MSDLELRDFARTKIIRAAVIAGFARSVNKLSNSPLNALVLINEIKKIISLDDETIVKNYTKYVDEEKVEKQLDELSYQETINIADKFIDDINSQL